MLVAQRRYARVFFTTVVAALGVIAAMVAVLDPHGVLPWSLGLAFAEDKICAYDLRRRIKGLQAARDRLPLVVLGASDAETGLDPGSELVAPLGGMSNLGLPGLTLPELERFAEVIAERRDRPRVLVLLNLRMFLSRPRYRGDYARSTLAGVSSVRVHLEYLLSLRSIADTYEMLARPLAKRGRVCRSSGYRDRLAGRPLDGARVFRRSLAKAHQRLRGGAPDAAAMAARFAVLEVTLERLVGAAGRVDVVVAPVHAVYQELRHRMGRGETFRRWRRDLTALVERVHAGAVAGGAAGSVVLWDFSGFDPVTTEPLPGVYPGVSAQARWFYDLIHFSAAAGDRLLVRVLDDGANGFAAPGGFGARLTSETLPGWERRVEAGRRAFLAEYPEVDALLARIVAEGGYDAEESRSDRAP